MRERDVGILREILGNRGGFGHREHLELAWSYLDLYSPEKAADVMAGAIRQVALAHGAADKYHETITRAWVHLVAVHRHRWGARTFDTFLERNAALLDTRLLGHLYSPEVLSSEGARQRWTAPDLRELPALAQDPPRC
jgi:hypothetical protein